MLNLPYREIWVIDTEFVARLGALIVPVCLVARELVSGRLVKLWQDDLEPGRPPFRTDSDVLFVAYYASAEIGVFLALGWPVPVRWLDLYAEFRNETNGLALPAGRGLLGALAYHHLSGITSAEKDAGRDLVMRGGPWSEAERREILDYCATDAEALAPLLERMLPRISAQPLGFGQALLRGRYMAAAARMERTGVPVDTGSLSLIRGRWDDLIGDLVKSVDRDFGVYEGTTFKAGLFADWLHDHGIAWPQLDSGQLALDGDTFRDMAKRYPELEPLKELRHSLGQLRLNDLAIGPDGRNRCLLSAYSTVTGRNMPSSSRYIFGPATWIRHLIKPDEGCALAYIDWSSQEVWIAAVLSGDQALLESVQSGDPYLSFAIRAGLAPPDATKESHEAIRNMCKTCVLGTNYGMQYRALALRAGISDIEARELLRRHNRLYPGYADWADNQVATGQLHGSLSTVFGWTINAVGAGSNSLRNFQMQANGAEMLRLACCITTEAGIKVCAPVHDALLVESAPGEDIDDVVAATRSAMAKASALVLGGVEAGTDATVIRWPGRFTDKRGVMMWETINYFL